MTNYEEFQEFSVIINKFLFPHEQGEKLSYIDTVCFSVFGPEMDGQNVNLESISLVYLTIESSV